METNKIRLALFLSNPQVMCKYEAALNLFYTLMDDYRYDCKILYQSWSDDKKEFLEKHSDIAIKYSLSEVSKFDIILTICPYFGSYYKGGGYNKWDLSHTKVVYLEYGAMSVYDAGSLANHPIYRLSWMTIVDCAESIDKIVAVNHTDPSKYVIGHPLFDYPYAKRYLDCKEANKRVLWTPHCTIFDTKDNKITGGRYSTFWTYRELFSDRLPRLFPDVEFVYKPHPFIRLRIERALADGIISDFDYDEYLDRCKDNSNVTIIEKKDSYYDEFLRSSLLLNDSLSFMIEYLPTLKPMVVLKDDTSTDRTPEMEKYINEAHYVARSEDAIIAQVTKLLYGDQSHDTKLDKRCEYLEKYRYLGGSWRSTNSQYIADVINERFYEGAHIDEHRCHNSSSR